LKFNNTAVHGLRIVGGFSFFLAGRFFALWGFFFLWVCVNYAAARSEALKRFLAALCRCFSVGFALIFAFLLFGMPVEAQILLVLRFVGVGSVFIYPKIKVA
jgi:hypothetical protein